MCFTKMPSARGVTVAPPEPTAAAYVSPEADPNSPAGAATTRRKLFIQPSVNPAERPATGLQIPGGNPLIGTRG